MAMLSHAVKQVVRKKSKDKQEEEEDEKKEEKEDDEGGEKGDYDFPQDVEKEGPVEVRFAFNVNNIYSINSVEETYRLDFDICFEWRDDRTSVRDPSEAADSHYAFMKKEGIDWDKAWHPKIEVVHQLEGDEIASEKEIICRKGIPKVTWWINSNSTIRSSMDLTEFPFDTQILHLQFRSNWFHSKQIYFRPMERQLRSLARNLNPQIVLNEWVLKECKADTTIHIYPMLQELEGEQNGVFHNLDISFKIKRISDYYINKIVFLFTFLFIMASCSFLIAPETAGDRTSITITTFLTAVAFHFVIADSLPKISYSTRMDKFMTWNYFFIFIAFIENIMIFQLAFYSDFSLDDNADREEIRKVDLICLGFFLFGGGINFTWFLLPFIRDRMDPDFYMDYKSDIPPRPDYPDPAEGKAVSDEPPQLTRDDDGPATPSATTSKEVELQTYSTS